MIRHPGAPVGGQVGAVGGSSSGVILDPTLAQLAQQSELMSMAGGGGGGRLIPGGFQQPPPQQQGNGDQQQQQQQGFPSPYPPQQGTPASIAQVGFFLGYYIN